MLPVSRPSAATRIVLALATAAALAAGPVASATASPVPEPSTGSTNQVGWQATVNELAVQARSTTSLAGRRMLHSELSIVLLSHRDW